jgi:hypothetical protein
MRVSSTRITVVNIPRYLAAISPPAYKVLSPSRYTGIRGMALLLYRVVALPGKVAAALFLLAGCATTEPEVGTGALTLSATVMLKLEMYMTLTHPGAFAVSPDGRHYGASICDETGCDEYTDESALLLCNAVSNDYGCRLLVRRAAFVWDGTVTYSRDYYFGEQPSDMPVALYWEHSEPDLFRSRWEWGYAFRHFNGDVLLYFRSSGPNGDCGGSIDPRTKPTPTFGLFCTEQGNASGRVLPHYGRYNASNGTTHDSKGNFVDLVIVPRPALRGTIIKPDPPFPEARHE